MYHSPCLPRCNVLPQNEIFRSRRTSLQFSHCGLFLSLAATTPNVPSPLCGVPPAGLHTGHDKPNLRQQCYVCSSREVGERQESICFLKVFTLKTTCRIKGLCLLAMYVPMLRTMQQLDRFQLLLLPQVMISVAHHIASKERPQCDFKLSHSLRGNIISSHVFKKVT